jgi:hypothetical protein
MKSKRQPLSPTSPSQDDLIKNLLVQPRLAIRRTGRDPCPLPSAAFQMHGSHALLDLRHPVMMCRILILALVVLIGSPLLAQAQRRVRVFVCLADNATQGLVPVPAKIGDGNDAAGNLYWGCDEALPALLRRSAVWKRISKEVNPTTAIVERLSFDHASRHTKMIVEAWRGSSMNECLIAFELAIQTGESDLLVFVGHNGLMDFQLPLVRAAPVKRPDVMVLCCKSLDYFKQRILDQGGRPVLLTTQFMYPGGFLVRDGVAAWLLKPDPAPIRNAAATAYAKNQGISLRSAAGVFAPLP